MYVPGTLLSMPYLPAVQLPGHCNHSIYARVLAYVCAGNFVVNAVFAGRTTAGTLQPLRIAAWVVHEDVGL